MVKAAIRVQNCNSFVVTDDEELKYKLWKAMRHRERNYFHSTLYKRKLWDGYTEFYKKDTGRFLTGLLPEIETALQYWGVDYKIIDEREGVVEFRYNKVNSQFMNKWLTEGEQPVTLYDYQVNLINKIIQYKRGIIQAPTSAGKTFIMLGILKALPEDTPTLILANTKSLVNQIYKDMVHWGFKNVGRLYDKYKDPNMFTCATIQSLHKIERLIPKIKAVVVDEIHLGMSKVPKKFYNHMASCSIRVGISATPFKFGGKDRTQKFSVKGYFGPRMLADGSGILTTEKLQERNILSPSKVIFYPINEPKLPFDTYQDAVTNGIANSLHFHQVVRRLAATLSGRTLILVERISHGDALNNLIPGSLWVQGKDNLDTRGYVIEALKKSKEDVVAIATQGIFNAGINVFVHNLINAAGGQADHQIVQRMGRGLRTAEDKERLNYFDFVFNINDYLYDHSMKRIKILGDEGHDVVVEDEIGF